MALAVGVLIRSPPHGSLTPAGLLLRRSLSRPSPGASAARMQGGGDEASTLAFIQVEGHEAGVAHVRAEHAEFLLAIDNAGGGIKVEHEAGGHLACVTGDEVVHHRIEGTHELAQREAVVQTAHGGLAGERGIRCA